jgi:hypothetical protein
LVKLVALVLLHPQRDQQSHFLVRVVTALPSEILVVVQTQHQAYQLGTMQLLQQRALVFLP